MRTTTLALALLAGLALGGCRIKKDPSYDAAAATCGAVASACSDHSDCCSYACVHGACIANSTQGGICRTSDDCNFTLTCVSGRCMPGYACEPNVGDTCLANNDCCSGNCVGESATYPPVAGHCADEHPPVLQPLGGPHVVPYFVTTVLHATATDPDPEDVLYYAWDLLSAPAGAATVWTATGPSASFTPSVKGQYQLRVRVVDGTASQRNRVTVSDTVILNAVNLPPVVEADPTHVPSTALRHTPMRLSGTVADPNGAATPVSCAWYAKPYGQPENPTPIASYPANPGCPPNPTTAFTTPIGGPEGVWEFRLEAFDGEFTTSSVQRVNVVNAAPVAIACAYECASPPAGGIAGIRVGNLGPTAGTARAIPLNGSATDANGDVGTSGFTWEWRLESAPAGSSLAAGLLLGSNAGVHSPPFDGVLDPDVAGTYVVRLHVDDGWSGTNDSTVPVRVEPYLRPLFPIDGGTALPFGGDIPDASYAHATDRIAFVGAEDSSGGAPRVWLLDPEGSPTTDIPSANLAHPAVSLSLDPTGTSGVIGEASYFERVSLSATPSASNETYLGFTPNVVLDTGNREYALAPNGEVYDISASGTFSLASCNTGDTCVGTRGAAAANVLWLLDEFTGFLRRYDVPPSSKLSQSASASGLGAAANVWASALYGLGGTTRDVVASTSARFSDTGTALNLTSPLPFALRHLDTTAVGTDIRGIGVSSAGDEVRTIGAGWAAPAASALALPSVGYLGTGYPTTARYAFVRTDGSRSYVVLRVLVAGKYRWYLARY